MKTIKLNHPKSWLQHGHWHYQYHTKDDRGRWEDYQFEINNSVNIADFWVVHESIDTVETVNCPRENVIFITSEEKTQIPEYPKKYLAQFGCIITSRDDIKHHNVIRTHYLAPWQIKKTYSELKSILVFDKTKNLSTLTSNSTWLEGHKKRYAFVNRMKGHFKDKLDWFCKGENFIEDKWNGLANYRYSLAIENSSHPNYFTEKITDCFLAGSMPIYWGCPNILDYFPEKSLILIDINDYLGAINKIEEAIEENLFDKYFNYLKEARDLVIEKYQFIPALIQTLEQNEQRFSEKKGNVTLKPHSSFYKKTLLERALNKLKTNF